MDFGQKVGPGGKNGVLVDDRDSFRRGDFPDGRIDLGLDPPGRFGVEIRVVSGRDVRDRGEENPGIRPDRLRNDRKTPRMPFMFARNLSVGVKS